MRKFLFRSIIIILAFIFWTSVGLLYTHSIVEHEAEGKEYSVSNVPKTKTALILGTSKYLGWGSENLYYKYRIAKAIELWRSKKVKYFLISGDNSTKKYNEPKMMKDDLLAAGIPESRIYLDYAGFRTFDSVLRAKEIFGQDSLIIISQSFHAKRASYIASKNDIFTRILAARDPKISFKTRMREYPARLLMYLDLYIFNTKPKFGGDKITIDESHHQFQ